jgi:hypothetical protein
MIGCHGAPVDQGSRQDKLLKAPGSWRLIYVNKGLPARGIVDTQAKLALRQKALTLGSGWPTND